MLLLATLLVSSSWAIKRPQASTRNSIQVTSHNSPPLPLITSDWSSIAQTEETCMQCVQFFNVYLQEIIDIITEYGVEESCSLICGHLNNSNARTTCTVLCDVIGVDKFWKIFLLDGINPIYACQMISTCPIGVDPAVDFQSFAIAPKSGYPGQAFTMTLNFTVINATGTGQFTYVVFYCVNNSKYLYSQTFPNYTPGTYSVDFVFQTSDNGTFPFGAYPVQMFMCANECGTTTPYSVALNQSALIEFDLLEPQASL
ncbi:hypothetical protein SAMD00019534_012230 [Acytostelium subglobosum LB1]|uniref:hypothetical protein n=1 Tax=Acytostelium subglobosum LB1 TaxID=1410327 RepID=UPI000644BA15|nr:hypothetical protein SAMD00019534_012230 [Acytostelium subglobosum LB1]GAM18048.1 hypothetical protein SAMD00019534_012230 [Acytostelium subglobosum LB1]|eukprot:XP_012758644.1 hypothetical protein SAMD00019534_012230 [Acytostelium subglobosum LB1]